MGKLLLLSPLILTVLIPALTSRSEAPLHGLRRALVYFSLYCVFYVFAMRFLWPRLQD